ncbi:MAG: hypothetical protein NT041_02725, partial [Candidatus Vogelbacteria bacterium]|nr:hypothetical protein [Candidatus Vogelbacteria bacterium]
MEKRPVFLWFGLLVGLGLMSVLALMPVLASAETAPEKETRLNAQLAQVNQEIADQQNLLKSKQKETASIKRDIDILTYKIKTAELNIKAKQIEIARLGGDIVQKQKTIVVLDDRLDTEKTSLSELLRQTRELDDNTFAEIILTPQTLSNLFVDVQRFGFVEEKVQATLDAVRGVKKNTETQKVVLEDRRDVETNAKKAIEKEKANIEQLNKEKTVLLNASKAKENSYKAVIATKEKERAAIRNALYSLRGAKNITFGQALDHAQFVGNKIGI